MISGSQTSFWPLVGKNCAKTRKNTGYFHIFGGPKKSQFFCGHLFCPRMGGENLLFHALVVATPCQTEWQDSVSQNVETTANEGRFRERPCQILTSNLGVHYPTPPCQYMFCYPQAGNIVFLVAGENSLDKGRLRC